VAAAVFTGIEVILLLCRCRRAVHLHWCLLSSFNFWFFRLETKGTKLPFLKRAAKEKVSTQPCYCQ
jgi:hypothetical protein